MKFEFLNDLKWKRIVFVMKMDSNFILCSFNVRRVFCLYVKEIWKNNSFVDFYVEIKKNQKKNRWDICIDLFKADLISE
jgi:hypothetical protein